MYEDLRQIFWWDGMKKDIASFVACCNICNKVKAEHQKPAGLLQPLPVSQWKWDDICMDLITGLPRSHRGNGAIWVIVDTLTKVAHFLPIRTTYRANQLAQLYVSRIVSLHGVPKTIFTSACIKNHLRQGISIHIRILVPTSSSLGDRSEVQHGLPSSDRWTD